MSFVTQIKHKLSHISAESWHWRLVSYIFENKAGGKACTYYWVQIPLSMLGLLFFAIIWVLIYICRALWVGIAWLFGYRFREKVSDFDRSVHSEWLYDGYKERKDGSVSRFAPWHFLAAAIALFIVIKFPMFGLRLLIYAPGILIIAGVVYFASAAWKFAPIVRLRKQIHDAWDGICPPLDVAPKVRPTVHFESEEVSQLSDGSEELPKLPQ